MIVTLKTGVRKADVNRVIAKIKELGFTPHLSQGTEKVVIGVIGEGSKAVAYRDVFESMEQVDFVTVISKPYKLVSREFRKENTIIDMKGIKIGGGRVVIMAGPSSVEARENLLHVAKELKKMGVAILYGGVFKPHTSPYAFQGLGEKALQFLIDTREITGLPCITEVVDTRQVELVAKYADILQVGATNTQNFDLLREVGQAQKPVMLKRGMATTIEEWLMAAEYIVSQGNGQVILCERGIRTFETATRFTLDLSAVPVLKHLCHLPVFVDPGEGVGVRDYVASMALASLAAGADGLLIEVHPSRETSSSGGPQALSPSHMRTLMKELREVAAAVGRSI